MNTAGCVGLGLLVTALAFAGCRTPGGGGGREPVEPVDDPNVTALVSGQHAFAVDVYRQVRVQEGNLLLSPFSIHAALSILRGGARGETARQLDRALHLPPQVAEEGWTVLHGSVRGSEAATLRVGNRLWIDDRFTLDRDFVAKSKAAYGAEVIGRSLDDGASVAREANDWVHRLTDGMLPTAMSADDVPPDAALLLVNAIYFHGKWKSRFERGNTRPLPFTTPGGARVDVPMMTLRGDFRYQENETVRTLALPYRGGTTEFVIFLPTAQDGLPRVEEALTGSTIAAWSAGGSVHEVDLFLPRFRFTNSHALLPVLAALGLGDFTDPSRVDLTGIGSDPRGPLRLSTASHTALIELDEEGTKAAAATVVAGSCRAPAGPEPILFRCDRPFLFLIRHVPTGAILFFGRMTLPPGA